MNTEFRDFPQEQMKGYMNKFHANQKENMVNPNK